MGFLEDTLGNAVPGGNVTKPLLIALGALLASGALHRQDSTNPASPAAPGSAPSGGSSGGLLGGLGGLLSRFQQSGHGDIMNSWIGSGPNREITPNQLGTVLGPDVVKTLSGQSGLSQQELMAQLSKILPGAVDRLTPNGRLPSEAEVAASR